MDPTTHAAEGSAAAPVLYMADLAALAFARGGPRMRRIGIVALARKMPIALWRTLEDGVMPQGARLIASEI